MSMCHNFLFRMLIQELPENVLTFTVGIRPTLETSGYLPHFLAVGIRPILETSGYLPHFHALKDKDVHVDWDVARVETKIK